MVVGGEWKEGGERRKSKAVSAETVVVMGFVARDCLSLPPVSP